MEKRITRRSFFKYGVAAGVATAPWFISPRFPLPSPFPPYRPLPPKSNSLTPCRC